MNSALEEIKNRANDPETRSLARQLAAEYVEAHPGEFTELSEKTIEECVEVVDVMRSAGLDESHWRAEAWIMYKWEPQNIGGTVGPVVRILEQGEELS